MIPAKAVRVEKHWHAQCDLDGCGWQSEAFLSFAAASAAREQHLTWHRLTEES